MHATHAFNFSLPDCTLLFHGALHLEVAEEFDIRTLTNPKLHAESWQLEASSRPSVRCFS